MSLIYLITRLPKLTLGEPAPMSCAELVAQARASLEGPDLLEFERVAMLEEVEETIRTRHRARGSLEGGKPVEVAAFVRTERAPTALDRKARDLPDWVLDPVPQHVLLRRYWQPAFKAAGASLNTVVSSGGVSAGAPCQACTWPSMILPLRAK